MVGRRTIILSINWPITNKGYSLVVRRIVIDQPPLMSLWTYFQEKLTFTLFLRYAASSQYQVFVVSYDTKMFIMLLLGYQIKSFTPAPPNHIW